MARTNVFSGPNGFPGSKYVFINKFYRGQGELERGKNDTRGMSEWQIESANVIKQV